MTSQLSLPLPSRTRNLLTLISPLLEVFRLHSYLNFLPTNAASTMKLRRNDDYAGTEVVQTFGRGLRPVRGLRGGYSMIDMSSVCCIASTQILYRVLELTESFVKPATRRTPMTNLFTFCDPSFIRTKRCHIVLKFYFIEDRHALFPSV